jgi:hypothetical protein
MPPFDRTDDPALIYIEPPREPNGVPVVFPADKNNTPPSALSTLLLVVEPAVIVKNPPLSEEPEPTEIATVPALPPTEVPELRERFPESPRVALPVSTLILPLLPNPVTVAVIKSRLPELERLPAPDDIRTLAAPGEVSPVVDPPIKKILPPILEAEPPEMTTLPPVVSPDPPERLSEPPLPDVDMPPLMSPIPPLPEALAPA